MVSCSDYFSLIFFCSCWLSSQGDALGRICKQSSTWRSALPYDTLLDAHRQTDEGVSHSYEARHKVGLFHDMAHKKRDMIADSLSLSPADLHETINTFDLLLICLSSVKQKYILWYVNANATTSSSLEVVEEDQG